MNVTAFDIAQRFTGVRELPGQLRNPQIMAMLQLDSKWPEDDSVPWCLSGSVEVMTSEGFVRFSDLSDSAKVAQVDTGMGGVSFVEPISVIRRQYKGPLAKLSGRDFSLTCDPNHRFLGVWNRANRFAGPVELRPISDLTSSLFIPSVATMVMEDNQDWSDREIKLLAAFLSDGFFRRDRRGAPRRISVQVSKDRKISALMALEPANVYRAPIAYGQSTVPLTTFEYAIPDAIDSAFVEYKRPRYDLLRTLSQRQLRSFLDTYVDFDGHRREDSCILYTSSVPLRDWLQYALTLAGYHSSWHEGSESPYSGRPCYSITYAPNKRTRTIRANQVEQGEDSIDLFCVEVPSGAIVIRDPNGAVIPCGNCSAFANYVAWLLRLPRSKNLAARSWLSVGMPILGKDCKVGYDVVILKRRPEDPGPENTTSSGHVGFYGAFDLYPPTQPGAHIYVLGGNQSDSVSIAPFTTDLILGIRRLYEEGQSTLSG